MSVAIDGPHDAPDVIVPTVTPKKSISDTARGRVQALLKAVTTRDGLLGDYNYAYLFTPNLPFMKKSTEKPPFFGLNDRMPVVLGILLGFQHCLAMLVRKSPLLRHRYMY
jgi:hypothetical protein